MPSIDSEDRLSVADEYRIMAEPSIFTFLSTWGTYQSGSRNLICMAALLTVENASEHRDHILWKLRLLTRPQRVDRIANLLNPSCYLAKPRNIERANNWVSWVRNQMEALIRAQFRHSIEPEPFTSHENDFGSSAYGSANQVKSI
jgi:hypothetical protein